MLSAEGHSVDCCDDGRKGEPAALTGVYHLLIVDIGLPHVEGGQLVRRVRAAGIEAPILIVSASSEVEERVRLLDLGADDFLPKPFPIAEFEARVRAHIRRTAAGGRQELEAGDLRIDIAGRRVRCGEATLPLTPREFALLAELARELDRVVPRMRLVDAVCTWDEDLTDNGLDIAVHRLRRKLEGTGVELRTVRGLGYLLRATAVNEGH